MKHYSPVSRPEFVADGETARVKPEFLQVMEQVDLSAEFGIERLMDLLIKKRDQS